MFKIKNIQAQEILDSRQHPTLSVTISLEDGTQGQAAIPSGASTGRHEALELRDGDPEHNHGLGVQRALANINGEIANNLIGSILDQTSLDQRMIDLDKTANKSRLGANAILGVSLAFARAASQSQNEALYLYFHQLLNPTEILPKPTEKFPQPMFNILNGGRHAESVDWQEFMVVPVGAPNFAEGFEWVKKVYLALKNLLEAKKLSTLIGDEGGFAPKLPSNQAALDIIKEAIISAGYEPGRQIALALDIAASEFKSGDNYELKRETIAGQPAPQLTSQEMIDWYEKLTSSYPIISIEDGLSEDDWANWQILTERLGKKINIVGDDLFVTNPTRLEQGIRQKVANAIIIKPNQIGTLTETLTVIKLAQAANYQIIVSHRSGETLDDLIADLAVGVGADFLKAGAPARPERLAKYNRLLEIEKELSV